MEYVINANMTPADAAKALRKAIASAPVTVYVSATIGMPAGEKTEYPWYTSIEITRKVAFKLLKDMQRFHDGKVERGDTPPMVEYREHVSEYEPLKGNRPHLVWIG